MPLDHSTDIQSPFKKNTDHLVISLKLTKPKIRGIGYWKFNIPLLSDNE